MTDIIFEAISMGVDAVIAGATVAILVTVLNLSAKLGSYASQQESYANYISYYRHYSNYNRNEISAADALSALFYFDEDIDIVLLDYDTTTHTASIVTKRNGVMRELTKTYTSSGSTFTCNGATTTSAQQMLKTLYNQTDGQGAGSVVISYDVVAHRATADVTYDAYLCEDLKKTPSDLYGGGTVTGIYIIRR